MIELVGDKIITDLFDEEFIELVWREWSHYDEGEIEALWAGMADWQMEEENLWNDGLDVERNAYFLDEPDQITLRKVGVREWIVVDADENEMETFVDELNVY